MKIEDVLGGAWKLVITNGRMGASGITRGFETVTAD
jgi:hypothetical protein